MGEDDFSWLLDPGLFTGGGQVYGGDIGDLNVDPSTLGPGASFDVGPGQIPSDVYQQLISIGGLAPGFSTSIPGGGGGGFHINTDNIMKGLGFDSSGGLDLMRLLGLLGPLAGGIMGANATRQAGHEAEDQIRAANAMLGGYITDAQSRYAPYTAAGQNAMTQAAGMQWNPLAPRFPALGTPASSLGAIYARGR